MIRSVLETAWRTPIRLEFGDADPVGWTITCSYFLACVFSVLAAQRFRAGSDGDHHALLFRFWLSAATLMLLLAVNKQLDLQAWLAEVGRAVAREEGWYEQRRLYQRWFIGIASLLGIGSVFVGGILLRHVLKDCGFALLGLAVLTTFILIRASSFHHVDHGLADELGGIKLRYILEFGGIMIVTSAAVGSWVKPADRASRGILAIHERG